ncbi:MAG: two-component system sensor histidine kinase/response regulator, partial [Sphingomonas sp.]
MERRGYHMTLAESGADGIAMARAEAYDLIAVDHYM